MDRFQAMETFVRVIETGSFSAAARDLRMGQPAISKAIAGLESDLGIRLLVRSTRKLYPTDAGKAFYDKAKVALNEADEAWSSAKGEGKDLTGRLRICAPVTFARLHVMPRLKGFLEAHPHLRLECIMDDREIDLLAENIDVALRMGALRDSGLTARKLASAPRLVVATPDYLERRGVPQTPTDLLAHSGVIYAQAVGGEEWRFRKGTSETSIRMTGQISVTAAEGLREGVLAGLGVGIASRWMMAREIESGAVIPLLTDWQLMPIDLWAVYPTGRLQSAKVKAFVAWIERVIKD
jgi:DNA-binding transcriptional LysR family regulator